ncbi:MAG: right-handed parallel beta-helix repeat-containing protein [Deltaproteobacteria bacterium]|nr:right-handed parallel beta-helix repeat-containing protein [Deltaproteobacteria bacterium]
MTIRDFVRSRLASAFVTTTLIVAGILTTDYNATGTTLSLSPQDNIQQAVDVSPPGTVFLLRPGIYRDATVTSLKDGDAFIGQSGAIMDGARQLTGWTRVAIQGSYYWTIAGGVPLNTPKCGVPHCCLAGYPRCIYVQNLYVDGIDYRHVSSLTDVVAGTWYYDFDGTDGGLPNNIYMALREEPNSHTVELGHERYAFEGQASSITIKNLVIEKYSAPIQSAAIQVEGSSWLIQNNEIRLNHGFGIKAKPGGNYIRVLGNRVHHNGQMGIGTGRVDGGMWDSNEVAYNNIDGVNPDFEAGGSKFVGDYITIRNNVVHDNYGTGLWTDEGAIYNTYDHNTCYRNSGGGIRYEISRYGIIENNTVYANRKDAQIVYTGSDHGRITGNKVVNDGAGGIFVQNIVGVRPRVTIYKVIDTQVTGNMVLILNPVTIAAGMLDFARPAQPEVFSDPTNLFDYNIYKIASEPQAASLLPPTPSWFWGENQGRGPRRVTWHEWRVSGHDTNGSLVTSSAKSSFLAHD